MIDKNTELNLNTTLKSCVALKDSQSKFIKMFKSELSCLAH